MQQAAKYLTGESATWGEGDWDGAPGGGPGHPPAGDGLFNQFDIMAAQLGAMYLTGPYAAVTPQAARVDANMSIGNDAGTGDVWPDAPVGVELASIHSESAHGAFTVGAAQHLAGSFDNVTDENIFKCTVGGSLGSVGCGNLVPAGGYEDSLGDLTIVASSAGGVTLGETGLVYVPVPEPATKLLAAFGVLLVGAIGRRLPNSC